MIDNLYKSWVLLAQNYFIDLFLIDAIWHKILKNYSSKNRHYHNLIHINSMLEKVLENKSELINDDAILFAIWFHDIIYEPTSKKNEEKSADFAKSTLKNISKDRLDIDIIYKMIISTKTHQVILDYNNDNAFLLDFDLAILGSDWKVYQSYIQNIRKEYRMHPNFLYNPSRKKVLLHFLEREKLFFTDKYQNLFEERARQNLTREIETLS